MADVYCDGLGACLGKCPHDAITIIEREAERFDEPAARQQAQRVKAADHSARGAGTQAARGCPGMLPVTLQPTVWTTPAASAEVSSGGSESPDGQVPALRNWPVQLHLVAANAPFLRNADLLLVADCVPFALADFHRRHLRDRPVVIGCPKLDDAGAYVEKLAGILVASNIRRLTVMHMEVPCCSGLVRVAQEALRAAGSNTPLEDVTVSIRGQCVQG